jgi:hypothetical protein
LGEFHSYLQEKSKHKGHEGHNGLSVTKNPWCSFVSVVFNNQCPQEEQFPPAHEPQDGSDMPETALPPLSAKKTDSLRLVCFPPQVSHLMGASAWLMGRMVSKILSQSLQTYS